MWKGGNARERATWQAPKCADIGGLREEEYAEERTAC